MFWKAPASGAVVDGVGKSILLIRAILSCTVGADAVDLAVAFGRSESAESVVGRGNVCPLDAD